jgi:hypothetical protein
MMDSHRGNDEHGLYFGQRAEDDDDGPASFFGATEFPHPAEVHNAFSGQEEVDESDLQSGLNCLHVARNPLGSFVQRTKTLWSQLTLSEISGSLGDLGTLVPLTVALARSRAILLAPALFFGGIANIVTGYMWDCPVCVQPMKSIAAVAISESLNQSEVTAGGIWMGCFCVVLGSTELIEWVNILVPPPVVSGLQIGVGLRLAASGVTMIAKLGWVDRADCILLAVLVSLLCMHWLREAMPPLQNEVQVLRETSLWQRLLCLPTPSQPPVGLYLFMLGCVFATIELATTNNSDGQYDLPLRSFGAPVAVWTLSDISWDGWRVGLLQGAIPQLPLTTLNSVISVCALAHSLYPDKRKGCSTSDAVISRKDMCVSVGFINLFMCPFGGMPNCHGAGGLAGQHRMGARHGASVAFLGINKVIFATFFGASLLTLLDAIPSAILGVMLAIAGQELATTGFLLLVKQCQQPSSTATALRKGTVIATVTAMVIVGLQKTHYGALSGLVTYMIYGDGITDFLHWLRERRVVRRWRQREEEEAAFCMKQSNSETSAGLDGRSSEQRVRI